MILNFLIKNWTEIFLCHSYRLSPSNQASYIIFDNHISLKWREEMCSIISKNMLHLQEREWEWELSIEIVVNLEQAYNNKKTRLTLTTR